MLKKRWQRGISLLESMVAIVVMALGILGILGVQLRTLSDTQGSARRAQAIRLIEDLSERVKVNPNALGNLGSYTATFAVTPADAPTDCSTTACTPPDLAVYDRNLWLATVKSTMPLGDASIFIAADETTAGNRRQLGVMVSWRESDRSQLKADGTADTAYTSPMAAAGTGSAGVSCPAGSACHLQYIQPSARCTPYVSGNATSPPLYCP